MFQINATIRCKGNLHSQIKSTIEKFDLRFPTVALLNVESKLFFSLIISKRYESHLVQNNKIINLSVQKGCMVKVLGCWEHLSMVWSVLKEARSKKSSPASIWLDIANRYGSIAHKLIFFDLWRYGIPNKWIQIAESYYAGIFIKSF